MATTSTIHVPHLGGITAGYKLSTPFSTTKPTLVLVNSFTTNAELYAAQFDNPSLTNIANLLAIELLGHGRTRCTSEHFTYWDTAMMNLQVLDGLGIERAFVLGTSQGGWVTVRMALLAPERILGIIPLGTSMDFESPRSRWTTKPRTPSFELEMPFCESVVDSGVGGDFDPKLREYWIKSVRDDFRGDDGRRRVRMCSINLRDRDGLHGRLADVTCPVLWMHGTSDDVYSLENAREEIEMFTGSPNARLSVVEGGKHFLSLSHPKEVDQGLVEFLEQNALPKI